MADTIAEAQQLITEYIERLEEIVGGMGDLATACSGWSAETAERHGDGFEPVGVFSAAAEQAEVIQQALTGAKSELEEMGTALAGLT